MEIRFDRERVVQAHTGQVPAVFAQPRDLVQLRAVAPPQGYFVAVGEGLGERRAPGARAEHGDAAAAHSPQTSLA